MKPIRLNSIIRDSLRSSGGLLLYLEIKNLLKENDKICFSMQGVEPFPSSFYNSSFGQLIDDLGVEEFKKRITFTEVTKTQSKWFGKYLRDSVLLSN